MIVMMVNLGATLGARSAIALAVLALFCLMLAVAIYLRESRSRKRGETRPASTGPQSPAPITPAALPQAPPPRPRRPEEEETLPPQRTSETPAIAAPKVIPIPTLDEAREAEQTRDFLRAADLYRQRSDFLSECRVLEQTDETERLAQLQLALGRQTQAVENLRKILRARPADESLRLLLVQALLDLGRTEEARELIEPLRQGDTFNASLRFMEGAAKSFQGVGEFEIARQLCRAAAATSDASGDLAIRTAYFDKMLAVAHALPPATPANFRKKILDAAHEDDADTGGIVRAMLPTPPPDATPIPANDIDALLRPHEVVVGHLALGGAQQEISVSVRSLASRASRLELVRMVGERNSSVVFEGIDRILDCPVAIRISRISTEGDDFNLIRERIRAIAALNHPNLSKITFADRFGPVMRIVSEFHSGGNLVNLLSRLDQLGLPLALRLLLQICAGLGAAHRQGILHGDLRPENIMIGHDNLTKLVDFALRPWPVHRIRPSEDPNQSSGSSRAIPPSEAQSDIIQFADLMETVLQRVTIATGAAAVPGGDPTDELREIVERARNGGFSSLSSLHRIMLEMLDRAVPATR